jgi:hypothetical protein
VVGVRRDVAEEHGVHDGGGLGGDVERGERRARRRERGVVHVHQLGRRGGQGLGLPGTLALRVHARVQPRHE